MYFDVNVRFLQKIPKLTNFPRFSRVSRLCRFLRFFADFKWWLKKIGISWSIDDSIFVKYTFNLCGHTYFYDKWFVSSRILKNRQNFRKIGQKSGGNWGKSGKLEFFGFVFICPPILMGFHDHAKSHAFSIIFGDFMGGEEDISNRSKSARVKFSDFIA